MHLQIHQTTLPFTNPVTTSRGTLLEKTTWFLQAGGALAEAPYFPTLSTEPEEEFLRQLQTLPRQFSTLCPEGVRILSPGLPVPRLPWGASLASGLNFGLECLQAELQSNTPGLLFDNPFTQGRKPIEINGLVWMDTVEKMHASALEKISQGFSTVKIKIGQYDWQQEKSLLTALRGRFPADMLTLRVDANGAYNWEQAKRILADLAALQIHSIEQPIKAGQFDQMEILCRNTPVPIALDEEIISRHNQADCFSIIRQINPQFLVLKPSLIGGLAATDAWIQFAQKQGQGWWITSALETPIALNALAQFCGNYDNTLPQGLSTGRIYKQEVPSPIRLEGNRLVFGPPRDTRTSELLVAIGAARIQG